MDQPIKIIDQFEESTMKIFFVCKSKYFPTIVHQSRQVFQAHSEDLRLEGRRGFGLRLTSTGGH